MGGGLKRYANKRDTNEPAIINALEAIGCTVLQMDTPCDLLVGRGGTNILIEVKNAALSTSHRQLTPSQVEFHKFWNGQINVCETFEEAIALVTRLTIRS